MRKLISISFLFFLSISLNAQTPFVKSMKWGTDLKIQLELVNDSIFILDVEDLHHSSVIIEGTKPVYYPVSLTENFIKNLKGKRVDDLELIVDTTKGKATTLWSAIHFKIGGGWTHFLNCMLYALESNTINITAILMERPKSSWKPRPMTETYKRTKKWEYYIPVTQKEAQKEYRIRDKKDQLGDVKTLPQEFIKLLQETSEEEYIALKKNLRNKKRAKIDLVKILLGANYLSQVQIDYISTAVLKAAIQYSANQLPSVIILDDLNAAVAMSLDVNGYRVEEVVFSDADRWGGSVLEERRKKIHGLIHQINEINQSMFRERLKKYYN